jgi:predicted RNase H-like HicB family nuclease
MVVLKRSQLFLALNKKFKIMKVPLKNIVWKEGNFYVAKCLNVEVSSFGDTKNQALKNLQEALDLYFEDMPIIDVLAIEQVEIVSTEMEHA